VKLDFGFVGIEVVPSPLPNVQLVVSTTAIAARTSAALPDISDREVHSFKHGGPAGRIERSPQPNGAFGGVSSEIETVVGERRTFEALFHAEFARLVRSLAIAEGEEEAADAVQEAFAQANRRWSRVGSLDDPGAWVRRVAVNRLANRRRNRRRRTELLGALRPPPPVDLDPLDLDLLAAVRALPPQQRRCICFHHIGGYSVAEVAGALGIAPGTVKSHLHEGRTALRRSLEVSDDA
jgi:RNA polymerase sigma-70 factor (ECF subfamily)